MSNLSLWHIDQHRSSLMETEVSDVGGDVRVNSLYSMISTGTETLVAQGNVNECMREKMAVPYMQGKFSLPIKYGYSLVGNTDDGTLVHVMHPHQQVAPVSVASLYILPAKANPRRMALISNLETIVNAIWDTELLLSTSQLSDIRIAVCGFGNIGALLAHSLRLLHKVSITVIESDPWRKQKAIELGWQVEDPVTATGEFDLLYHTSCSNDGLQWCIDHAALEACIIELSWYANRRLSLKLGEHFHYNRVRLIASQVSNIPKHKDAETFLSRKALAVDLLSDNSYDLLLSDDIPFRESANFFNNLRTGNTPKGLIWLINYQ